MLLYPVLYLRYWLLSACLGLGFMLPVPAATVGPVLDPNLTPYPASSLVDRSTTLDAPAGKHGFVTVKDGHFVYADGSRARFFGVNLAKDAVFIEKEEIDRVVDLFARAGVNMVRIHHIDDTQGILDPEGRQYFHAKRLDTVDYWIARLRARGIYLCLDLNDYRTFRANEGVANGEELGRGAKPYAVFDRRLIELQQEYARRFLVEHVNPYTGVNYASDPAIAFLEIYDENGLFIRRSDWPKLREPYKTAFVQRWNAWLKTKYGTTAGLREGWTDATGASCLTGDESLESGTVQLPRMDMVSNLTPCTGHPLLASPRVSDGALFAFDVQIAYLQEMKAYLRGIGVAIPVTAVGAQDVMPDLVATAAATDYIGINFYWDHPCFDVGKDWSLPAYFSLNNPIADNQAFSFPSSVSLARMHQKPLVVRELGYCYPNAFRAAGTLEAAAYGAMLDIDALILFTYDARSASRKIGFFDISKDPLRWGVTSQAARLFLRGDVTPATHALGMGYTQTDIFSWYDYLTSFYTLGAVCRVENYTNVAALHPYHLLITAGRSCGGRWMGDRLLLFANKRFTDLRFREQAPGMDTVQGYRVQTGRNGDFPFTFSGLAYETGSIKQYQAWPGYSLENLKSQGLAPVATSETLALGFVDYPQKTIGFRNLTPDLGVRITLDALRFWANAPVSHSDRDQGIVRSTTGQLTRDTNARLLRIDTPGFQALAGRFDTLTALHTSALSVTTPTPIGTITAESLDDLALTDSRRVLVKMTSRANNDQVKIIPATGKCPKPNMLSTLGDAPILTEGTASKTPTRIEIGGKLLIAIGLQNGTWEYLMTDKRSDLFIDTEGITITLPARPQLLRWDADGQQQTLEPKNQTIVLPKGARQVEIVW